MNVEHIPAEDVDMLPCGADWQSRHLESEKRKAEIRDRIHKQAEQGQKTAKDYFRPAKPTPSIYDSDLKRVHIFCWDMFYVHFSSAFVISSSSRILHSR